MDLKRLTLLLPFVGMLIAPQALTSCKDDDGGTNTADTAVVSTQTALSLTADAQTVSHSVGLTDDWSATLSADWITIDPASGTAADNVVSITAQANEGEAVRTATITFTAERQTETLTITQAYKQAYADGGREDIMLQGFYWDSQKATGWTKLMNYATDIANNFTCVWFPPSASAEGGNTVGGTNVGYHPRQWNDQNSCWGTAENLKKLISTLHDGGVKVIADAVVNHRAGDTGWGNFTEDDFGTYGSFQLDVQHICSTDEMNDKTQCSDVNWLGKATGAADSGENWGGARDLDHTSEYVQQDVIAYLSWLRGEYGYDGWRYDFCKGFDGKYVAMYNDATDPYLSVGEYWDGGYDAVNNWLKATSYKSMAFDFPAKYDAINSGVGKSNFASMTWKNQDDGVQRPAGLIHHQSTNAYAVTFVDNHDTYRDDNKYTGNVPQAYAFIMSSPGIPCVFWPHWQDRNYKAAIENMIAARRAVGLTNVSDVQVTKSSTYYEAQATGRRGSLIVRIGSKAPTSVPEGYELACSGTGWAFYTK